MGSSSVIGRLPSPLHELRHPISARPRAALGSHGVATADDAAVVAGEAGSVTRRVPKASVHGGRSGREAPTAILAPSLRAPSSSTSPGGTGRRARISGVA